MISLRKVHYIPDVYQYLFCLLETKSDQLFRILHLVERNRAKDGNLNRFF